MVAFATTVVTALLVLAVACGGGDDDDPTATDTPGNGADPTDAPVQETDLEVGTLEGRLLYSKTELSAPAGEAFTIIYDNTDVGLPHNLSLYATEDAYKADEEAIAGSETLAGPITQEVDVPALDAGDYFFICLVHPTTMFGTLHVVE